MPTGFNFRDPKTPQPHLSEHLRAQTSKLADPVQTLEGKSMEGEIKPVGKDGKPVDGGERSRRKTEPVAEAGGRKACEEERGPV